MVRYEEKSYFDMHKDKFTLDLVIPNLNAQDYNNLRTQLLNTIVKYEPVVTGNAE